MARSVSFPHLDRVTPPLEEISHIWAHLRQVDRDYIRTFFGDIPILAMCQVDWNFLGVAVTFWDSVHAVFNIQGTELTPTIEEYRTLVERIAATHGIVEPNFHTTRLVLVSRLLGVHRSQLQAELAYFGGTEIVTAKLLRFIEIRAREERKVSKWIKIFREIAPKGFKWRAAWMPPGPMTLKCPDFNGVPLVSHAGSTTYFPARVVRQLGGLQTVPKGTARTEFQHTWREDQTSIDRLSEIERVMTAWQTTVIEHLYFPEHPTQDERDFQATEEYILRFYRWGPSENDDFTDSPPVESSASSGAPQRMAEENQLAVFEEDTLPTPIHSQAPTMHAPPPHMSPAGVSPAYRGASPTHLPPPASSGPHPAYSEGQPSSAADDRARITVLESTVNQLAATMATNMAELMALLKGPNRASSSFTSPPGYEPAVDPSPWAQPTLIPDNGDTSAPTIVNAPAAHPVNNLPTPPSFSHPANLPAVTLIPSATMLEPPMLVPPPISTSVPAPVFASVPAPTSAYKYCSETPPTLLELSTMEMTEDQGFEAYAVKWRARAAKHVPPISEAQQIQLFHSTLKGAYYLHLLAHTSSFSNLIDAGKKLDIGIKLGKIEAQQVYYSAPPASFPSPVPQQYAHNYARAPPLIQQSRPPASRTPQPVQRAPATQDQQGIATQTRRKQFTPLPAPLSHIYRQLLAGSKSALRVPSGRTRSHHRQLLEARERIQQMIDDKQLTFNTVKPPNVQSNPLLDHGSSSGPSINMIGVCAIGEYETGQEAPAPFVIEYVPTATGIGYAGFDATPAPFVIEIPAREPYQDSKVPWTYEGSVGNLERQFSVMGVTRSGRVYENPKAANKGKGPAVPGVAPEAPSIPSKKVTEEEAEAFMKIIKASEYKMNVDFNCIRPSKTAVRAFDGSRREVNGEIDLVIEINRGIPIHPLSYFFPGPPHIVGGTLDGLSSDSDSEPVDMPNICAVTEKTTPRAYICLAQENEELNNWTSVSRYSAVIADV
ncbi:hypothetical protein CRG98_006030 [Punica granatum]|uniref:DUF7745 domain-containing protein n=1 Tax=Punica granatum TaxID=22663 RepID=A0A2I0KYQ1_PUNGR|nr:hypothetical protein CRG98_006030 [Punica granatum]